MNPRIKALTELTLQGKMYANPVPTEYDRHDLFLSPHRRNGKRIGQYILNQEPVLTKYSKMTGFFNFDGTVPSDAFRRKGHPAFGELFKDFYLKPVDNLSTFEWQHATADYQNLLQNGIRGILNQIRESAQVHTNPDKLEFLHALKTIAEALIAWAHKCGQKALELSEAVTEPEYRANLQTLATALQNVPENKPASFYEAVLSIYICFAADPDSVGTLDRYLRPFYESDIQKGILTQEEAREYLQELFLMLQAATHVESANFTRGAESHFCIGGYLPDGSDGFDDLSRLILESLLELPTYIPQVTFRWTDKTPRQVFRYVLDQERNDPHKRVAFQNDHKRIQCYTKICGFPFEKAVGYTTVGCNEPAFLGSISGSTSKINFLRSTALLFHEQSHKIENAASFEEYYEIFLEALFADLTIGYAYDDMYNRKRAEDVNYISSLFFQGCIEKAKSLTQGAADTVIASPMLMGIANVIDSLIIVKQFVFDEKIIPMKTLIQALQANWSGYEDLHILIKRKGDFFGNDTDRSNYVAQKLYQSMYEFLKDRTNLFGYHWLMGDLFGYNPHFKWFGQSLGATPDGRCAGEPLKYGLGQSGGYDRKGLTALLNAVAKVDPNAIGCGSTVTNLLVDEQLVKNDDHFEKTVDMLETYFKMGGVHFQLNYVSKEDLCKAKLTPEDYRNLRVRVSGFSEFFVKLNPTIQDDIIDRTVQK